MRITERSDERSGSDVVQHHESTTGVVWVHTRVERGIRGAVSIVGVLPDGTEVARLSVEPEMYDDGDRACVEMIVDKYVRPVRELRLIG